jgi:hypothetical protein
MIELELVTFGLACALALHSGMEGQLVRLAIFAVIAGLSIVAALLKS